MYDFEKYYSEMEVKADANIDLSGVHIENPQGNPNEHVTNNVMYVITGAFLSNGTGFVNPVIMGINDRLRIDVSNGSEVLTTYMALLHPLDDILYSGITSNWHPGISREGSLDLDIGNDGNIKYTLIHDSVGGRAGASSENFTNVRVFIVPRYEFITNNGSDDIMSRIATATFNAQLVNENVISSTSVDDLPASMMMIYGLLGLNGRRKMSMKWMRKATGKTAITKAVIGYDLFRKRLESMSEWCAENNYGIDVKYYDRSMAEPLPDNVEDATDDDYRTDRKKAKEKHRAYIAACEAADITRTNMKKNATFLDAYGTHLPEFLSNPKVSRLIDNLVPSGDGTTAIIPPIKDAVKGIFYPRDEIERDFYDQFVDTYEGLKDAIGIMRRYLSGKTRMKINRLGEKYRSYASNNGTLAFDLDSVFNGMDSCYDALGAGSPDTQVKALYCIGCKQSLECVTVYPRVFQINGTVEETTGGVASWGITPPPMDNANSVPCGTGNLHMHFVNAASGDYATVNYAWNKGSIAVGSSDIRTMLIERYNWILKRDGLDPVDAEILNLDDNSFSDGYNSANDTDPRYIQCKRYIQFVGGWMNLVRDCGTKEGIWKFVDSNPMADNESVMEWLARLANNGLVKWDLTGTYRIIEWDTSSNAVNGTIGMNAFVPCYVMEWGIDPESSDDIDDAVKSASIMIGAYKEIKAQLVANAFNMSPTKVARVWDMLENVSDSIDELKETLDRIIWYQAFVNESVFTNRSMYLDAEKWIKLGGGDDDDYISMPFVPWALPARFMVPVSMYRKVKKKYKRWGRTRHKTVKVYDGVRWAEIRFYDLNVFNEYPQVEETPGNIISLGKPASIENVGGRWQVNFDEPLPEEIWNSGTGDLIFGGITETTIPVTFDTELSAHVPEGNDAPTLIGEHVVDRVKVPPERSRNDSDNKTAVTAHIKMPSLPYDEEIRKKAFTEYGSLSQDRYFEVTRNGGGGFDGINDSDRFDGWKVFRNTSRKIQDMREGIGLYDKVAFLISILEHEFGASRVELINTWRSLEDQKGICTGGPESEMLSWHNYGLAAKILVYQQDGTTPIVDGSDDMRHLVQIAKAFTEICAAGRVGVPCNVVWCGRLTINPSLFDWEFLPIGVGHKDAFRFREAIMDQKDPVMEYSYVDVDGNGMVTAVPNDNGKPFILGNSSVYRNARIINGHHYVSPNRIPNYTTPSDIVLYDLVEYIDLINLKMNANGSTLGARSNMYEWKSMNDTACEQLIRYFALTNNIKSAKALLAGDFIERYQAIEDAYYAKSAIDYVKGMLGEHYAEAYITVDSDNDAGYISLANGHMYIKTTDIIPDNVPTIIDMHGQERVDKNHIRRGVWRNGLFYGVDEIELPYVESDTSVIDGYVDGKASYGDALSIHQAIAYEIHTEYLRIRDMFEQYSGAVMFDRFQDGPNASKFNQLENEFGAIAAQDLMDFDEIESMLAQTDINRRADVDTNGERNGVIRDENGMIDIYEKVVNNAQVAGMKKAVKTSERMHITDRGNGMTPGEIYRAVMEGRAPGANDIMNGR